MGMISNEPGPGQMYAIAARKHQSTLCRLEPGIKVGICWCPAQDNEIADGWAKHAADEPGEHGMEWLNYSDRHGRRCMSLPRSVAHLKRQISYDRINRKYRPSEQETAPRPGSGLTRKRLSARLRHATPSPENRPAPGGASNTKQTREHLSKSARHGRISRRPYGQRSERPPSAAKMP